MVRGGKTGELVKNTVECPKGMKWKCFTREDYYGGECLRFFADTEADARAKMLIYLIENNLMRA